MIYSKRSSSLNPSAASAPGVVRLAAKVVIVAALAVTSAALRADEGEDVIRRATGSSQIFESGYRSWDRPAPECEADLAPLIEGVDELLTVGIMQFAKSPAREKVKLLHGVIDRWYEIVTSDGLAQTFVTGDVARVQMDVFLRRARSLLAEPLMRLQKYADELLFMSARLSLMRPVVITMSPSHQEVFLQILETAARLKSAKTDENHALRVILDTEIALLRPHP